MKVLIPTYTFNAESGQITIVDYSPIKLEQLLLITNTSKNKIIYNFANPALGATITENVISLIADTETMDDSDSLQIFIEDYHIPSSEMTLSGVKVEIETANTISLSANTLFNSISGEIANSNKELKTLVTQTGSLEANTNTRLDVLTAVDYSTEAKQDSIITLLNALTAKQDTFNLDISAINVSTDELEDLIRTVNVSVTATNTSLETFNRQLTAHTLTINQNVSSTNPRLFSIDAKLTTLINQTDQIEGYIDGVETQLNSVISNTQVLNWGVGTVRTSPGPVSGINLNAFSIWSVEGTSYAGYDQYLQIVDTTTNILYFTQLIKSGENFKFNFRQNGAGDITIDSTGAEVRNSLTPFSHTPGNSDLYLLVRGIEI